MIQPYFENVDLRTAIAVIKEAGYRDAYGQIGKMTDGYPIPVNTVHKRRTMIRISNNVFRITTHGMF